MTSNFTYETGATSAVITTEPERLPKGTSAAALILAITAILILRLGKR